MQPSLAYGLVTLLSATAGIATFRQPRQETALAMAQSATAFLDVLTPAQRSKALAAADDARRTTWNFVPMQYPGIALADLDAAQRDKAQALLRAALSAAGYRKVTEITGLETVLRELESTPDHDASHRDPLRYWILIFGDPAHAPVWSLAVQGHHVSLHFAVSGKRVVATTPAFLGANPHEVRSGASQGLRVLAAEEDKTRALLESLTAAQRHTALLQVEAPKDVILGPQRAADFLGEPKGLAYRDLDAAQQRLLWELLTEFAGNLPADVEKQQLERIEAKGRDGIHFAWAGSADKGKGHYWRLHGPGFVIEYDNTQNDANHVHTVWRDLTTDFGGDLLRQHLERDH